MDTVLIVVMPRRRRGRPRASRKSYASFVGTEPLATIIMHLPVKDVKVCFNLRLYLNKITFLDFVHLLILLKNTAFWKLYLFPPSGKNFVVK
jgi:hypothetical protein